MIGTVKQIAWAEKIRSVNERKMEMIFVSMKAMMEDMKAEPKDFVILEKAIENKKLHEEEATFWINTRDALPSNSGNCDYIKDKTNFLKHTAIEFVMGMANGTETTGQKYF